MYEMKLRITMLGEFCPVWRRRPLDLENAGAKVLMVWQALLYAGDQGVSRDDLQMRLYGHMDSETANSLRALVFRLRRFLTSRGLDGNRNVRVRGGVYMWVGPKPLVDAHRFAQAAEKIRDCDTPRRVEDTARAAALYTGRLLPDSTDPVIQAEADRLEKLYLQCLRVLIPIFRRENRLEELLELASKAACLLPCQEEWTLCRLDCLIAMGRCEEAMQIYQEAVSRLASEQGVAPSDAMLGRCKELSTKLRFTPSGLTAVQADLWEHAISTSYFCSYPGFVDCYRLATRGLAREKNTGFLMLCTLTDVAGAPLEKSPRQEASSEALKFSIGQSLRGSDVYTCYSPNQYLILLMGLQQQDCDRVARRIRDTFSEQSASWGCRLKFETAQATAPLTLPHSQTKAP